MKPILRILSIAFVLWINTVAIVAQNDNIRWGEISDEDLKMTTYPEDAAATAVVLSDVGTLEFDFYKTGTKFVFERHRRIKILTRAGFEKANIGIPHFKRERINSLKAQIILPSGERIELGRKDFFDKEYSEFVSLKTFAFPNVEVGAVIEYKYALESEYLVSLQDWSFQEDIPVRWSEYKLAIPEWFNYVILHNGRAFDISERSTSRQNLLINMSGNGAERSEFVNVPANIYHHQYALKHIPAMKEEAFTTTLKDYYARIRFQLKSVQWPNNPVRPYMTSWNDVAKSLMDSDKFGMQFTKAIYYDKIWAAAEPLLAQASTDKEKAMLLYAFVGKNMAWDESYQIYCQSNLNTCFERRKGSVAEVNLMLLALFRAAGITAHPVLLSTRDNGSMFELYPFLDQFNFVMVVAEIDGQTTFFDVGNIYRPGGHPRIPALNGNVWKVDLDAPAWLPLPAPSAATTLFFRGKMNEAGELVGTVKGKWEGYDAIPHREGLHGDASEAYWQKTLSEALPDLAVSTATLQNLDTLASPLTAEIQCNLGAVAQITGDYVYLSPVLLPAYSENPFKLENRTYPVTFPHPSSYQFVLQLEMPEGYMLEEAPANLNLALPNKGGTFQLTTSQSGNILNVIYKLRMEQLLFLPEEYPALKDFFNRLINKQESQIVLKRQ